MSVTEYERNHLFVWFEEHMGKERAATMMSLLPPAGWADVAMKRDLGHLEVAMKGDLGHLEVAMKADVERLEVAMKGDLGRLEVAMKGDLGRLEVAMKGDLERVEVAMKADLERLATKTELHELESRLQRTFVTWILTAQAAVIAAVGLIVALAG